MEGIHDFTWPLVGAFNGIAFPAVQVPSANPNTLDDYEEGTATVMLVPGTSGTITLDVNYNCIKYTKIGRAVSFIGRLIVSAVNIPVGDLKIVGLPFVCAAGDSYGAAIAIYANGLEAAAITTIKGNIAPGTNIAYLRKFAAGVASITLAADVKANSDFNISGTYFI